jgi:hypothetical protein
VRRRPAYSATIASNRGDGAKTAVPTDAAIRAPAQRVDQWRSSGSQQLTVGVHQHELFLDPDGEVTVGAELRDGGASRWPRRRRALRQADRVREVVHETPLGMCVIGATTPAEAYPLHDEPCPARVCVSPRLSVPVLGTCPA